MSLSGNNLDDIIIRAGGPKCVFVIEKHCPPKTTTSIICRAAEKNRDVTCYGAQLRAGLWRIQTLTAVGRITLLACNLQLNGKQIEVHDRNPFLRGDVEDDAPSTKLSIDDMPFSVSNDAIDRHLKLMGVICRTKIKMECDRDPGLTEYRTGRRSVQINLPTTPLPRKTRIGNFQATLFHWEMKERDLQCRRCLQPGHKFFECKNEEACLDCHMPGHRRGDTKCKGKQNNNELIVKTVVGKPTEGKKAERDKVEDNEEKEGERQGNHVDDDMPNYKKWCKDCKEYGHGSGDCMLCYNYEVGRGLGSPNRFDVIAPCKVCGSTEHKEDSLECEGSYPPMETEGRERSEQTCVACGQSGHGKGNPFCKKFTDQMNNTEEVTKDNNISLEAAQQVKVKVNITDTYFAWALADSMSLDILFAEKDAPIEVENEKEGEKEEEVEKDEKEEEVEEGEKEEEVEIQEECEKDEEVDDKMEEEEWETEEEEGDVEEKQEKHNMKGCKVGVERGKKVQTPITGFLINKKSLASPETASDDTVIGRKRGTPASSPDGIARGNMQKGAKHERSLSF